MVRLFVAIDLSDEVKRSIVKFRDAVSGSGADVKPVEYENLHITLRFLGEVPQQLVNEVKASLSRLSFSRFKIHVKGVGAFPSATRPRVIWVGVEEGSEELNRLHEVVEGLVGKYGVDEEERFTPHITVARVRGRLGRLSDVLREWEGFDFGWQEVANVKLKKSTLTPKGPIYEDLLVVNLNP